MTCSFRLYGEKVTNSGNNYAISLTMGYVHRNVFAKTPIELLGRPKALMLQRSVEQAQT